MKYLILFASQIFLSTRKPLIVMTEYFAGNMRKVFFKVYDKYQSKSEFSTPKSWKFSQSHEEILRFIYRLLKLFYKL